MTPSTRRDEHRVLVVYASHDAAVFQLPAKSTLGELCEQLSMRAAGRAPVYLEVNVGRAAS
jgi:hypothetical protein